MIGVWTDNPTNTTLRLQVTIRLPFETFNIHGTKVENKLMCALSVGKKTFLLLNRSLTWYLSEMLEVPQYVDLIN